MGRRRGRRGGRGRGGPPPARGWRDAQRWLARLPELARLLEGRGEGSESALRAGAPRVALVGLAGAGKSSLCNWLYGAELSPVGATAGWGGEEALGLFSLADLPEGDERGQSAPYAPAEPMGAGWSAEYGGAAGWEWYPPPASPLPEANLVVFVVDGVVGMQPAAFRWFCRLRARGQPLVVALNKADALEGRGPTLAAGLAQRLAAPVVAVSARTGENVVEGLLPRMVEQCPALRLSLGRELACFRRRAGEQLVREAALGCGLFGVAPVPLVDLPFQVALELRLVMQLATLYGQTPDEALRHGLRAEAAVALGVALALRYAAQQLAKLVPGVGWLLSGALGLMGVWLVGWGALLFWERRASGQPLVARPAWRRLRHPLGQRPRDSVATRRDATPPLREKFRIVKRVELTQNPDSQPDSQTENDLPTKQLAERVQRRALKRLLRARASGWRTQTMKAEGSDGAEVNGSSPTPPDAREESG